MLELRRLRMLREFANRGSIHATAVALGYSASAVSQQLSALEREVGAQLLERTARTAELTDLGEQLAEHAGRILAAVENAEADLAARTGKPSGRVVISAFPTAAVALAPTVARRLRKYPDVTLLVRQGATQHNMAEVLAGNADIALVDDWTGQFMDTLPTAMRADHLCHEPLLLAVPRRHWAADEEGPIDLRTLAKERWIAASPEEPSRKMFDRLLADARTTPPLPWEFEGLDTVLALVAQGTGIAVVPNMALAGRRANIVVRPLPVHRGRDIYAVSRTASSRRPAIAIVLDALHVAVESTQR
jgi:DNA-binding transcriptional LysR family regulator